MDRDHGRPFGNAQTGRGPRIGTFAVAAGKERNQVSNCLSLPARASNPAVIEDPFQEGGDPLAIVEPFSGHAVDWFVPYRDSPRLKSSEARAFRAPLPGRVFGVFVGQEVAKCGEQERSEAAAFGLGDRHGVLFQEV